MKKRILSICLIVALLAVVITGATLAYMTDKDEATNTFTIGKVDIELSEDTWDAETEHKLVPGVPVPKDPTVTVVNDSEDCWVFVDVAMNKFATYGIMYALENDMDQAAFLASIRTDAGMKSFLQDFFVDLNLGTGDAQWTLMNRDQVITDAVSYASAHDGKWPDEITLTFGYNSVCELGDEVTLFTAFQLPAYADHDQMDKLNSQTVAPHVNITAKAIQAEGLDTQADAYAAIQSEYGA